MFRSHQMWPASHARVRHHHGQGYVDPKLSNDIMMLDSDLTIPSAGQTEWLKTMMFQVLFLNRISR